MKVMLADHAGACYGVQRALDMTEEVVKSGSTACTLGPLIHNPQVVADLESQGVKVAQTVEEADCETVVIRSHGVTPEVLDEISAKGLKAVDATCPHVARAQKAAAELGNAGCRVLVVGELGHPEVEGLLAYAAQTGAKVDAVTKPEDVPEDLYAPVGVVVQTTQTREALDAIVDELQSRGFDPDVRNTICSATRQRQKSAAELAGQVDAMIVIGGRNSSNTTRLAEICRAKNPNTQHIEAACEIDAKAIKDAETVGITAGASTPESQIQQVVRALEQL